MRPRVAFILTTPCCRELERLLRRHRTDFLPVLKNPPAARRRFEFCRSRTAGWSPAGALMVRVDDFVDAARELTGVRSALCNRVHLFGSRIRIDGETSSRMRPDAARFWKSEGIAIRDEDCISQDTFWYRTTVHHGASQLPGPPQPFVIPLSGGRTRGWFARCVVCRASGNCCHGGNSQNRCCFDMVVYRQWLLVESSVHMARKFSGVSIS